MSARVPTPEDVTEGSPSFMQRLKQVQETAEKYSKTKFGLFSESEKIDSESTKEVAHQRSQLENTLQCLDEAETNLSDSQKYLNGIKSVFTSVSDWWSTGGEPTTGGEVNERSQVSQPTLNSHSSLEIRQLLSSLGSHDATAENLEQSKALATALGSEIDGQNQTLDRLQTKADSVDSKMADQIKRMEKLMK